MKLKNDAKIRRRENDYFYENEILEPFMKIHETSFLDQKYRASKLRFFDYEIFGASGDPHDI